MIPAIGKQMGIKELAALAGVGEVEMAQVIAETINAQASKGGEVFVTDGTTTKRVKGGK